jgi:DNA-binding response OmpR family regulator
VNILIADDDRVATQLVQGRLRAAGYKTIIATDAMQALMMAMRHIPAAVLLDINMPGGSGLHVLQRLKASSKTCDIPVIVISGTDDPTMADKVRSMNADEFLAKPVNFDVLLPLLASLTEPDPPPPPAQNPPPAPPAPPA